MKRLKYITQLSTTDSLYQKTADFITSLQSLAKHAKGFDWNKSDLTGHTLLHNVKTNRDRTALQWAMVAKDEAAVTLLVNVDGIELPDNIAQVAKENKWTTTTAALEAKKSPQPANEDIAALKKMLLEQQQKINELEKIVRQNNTSTGIPYLPSSPAPQPGGNDGDQQKHTVTLNQRAT